MIDQMVKDEILGNFRTDRYHALNKARWDHFLSLEIPIANQRIFEPGAGIGDQTEWLLEHGASYIYVNEGRKENRLIIRERFGTDPRVSILHGDLETCLSDFTFNVDLIFCYGVYYHLRDTVPDLPILGQFSTLGKMIAFDYLEGNDNEYYYGYDNPSTSISWYAPRPRKETVVSALKKHWAHVYDPIEPLTWQDPVASEQRVVAIASHIALDNPNLVEV